MTAAISNYNSLCNQKYFHLFYSAAFHSVSDSQNIAHVHIHLSILTLHDVVRITVISYLCGLINSDNRLFH